MKARIHIDPARVIGTIDPNIYGQFMSRRPGCSEGGLYDPSAETADEHGIRRDVSDAIGACKPSLIRWPGGCTGTSYHWLDGVGPVAERPSKVDLHFGWAARYDFGTDEFLAWCARIGAEPHLNFTMGTGTLEEAAAWVEYCNSAGSTYYADLRRRNGRDEPWNVKYWQLGNEVYGPWELGHCEPREYAVEAREWAKTIRRFDPSVRLLAVGGDEEDNGEWAWQVIPEVAPWVDYITFHTYWRSPAPAGANPWLHLLAGPHSAERKIQQLGMIAETVYRDGPRPLTTGITPRQGPRRLKVACTEWNTMPGTPMMDTHRTIGSFTPSYHLHDALALATFANIMQRNCRDVTLATVAQSINVVGLIGVGTRGMWLEPTYWAWQMLTNNTGSIALDAWVESDTFDCPERRLHDLAYLDASATLDPTSGTLFLSLVNRHPDDSLELDARLIDATVRTSSAQVLYHEDPQAMNGHDAPNNVRARDQRADVEGNRFTYSLQPHSYTILRLSM